MKKLFLLLTAIMATLSASAYDFEVDGIYYNFISWEDGTCEVTYCKRENGYYITPYEGKVEVPETVNFGGRDYIVTTIGGGAFAECHDLTEVVLPNSILHINWEAFDSCWGLTSITLPSSVVSIGQDAFYGCRELETIEMPGSIREFTANPFTGCQKLNNIIINGGNNLKFESDCLVFEDGTLIAGLNKQHINIPNSVRVIGIEAFKSCLKLESIDIPNTVMQISERAFQYTALKSVKVPESVATICDGAFRIIDNLETVEFENPDATLGGGVFTMCKNLKSVTLPKNLRVLDEGVFIECKSLETIELPAALEFLSSGVFLYSGVKQIISLNPTPPQAIEYATFTSLDKQETKIYVPEGSVNDYKNAEGWKEFFNINPYDPTGINGLFIDNATSGNKFIPYNLQGQPVDENYKGIVIRNGKKMVRK